MRRTYLFYFLFVLISFIIYRIGFTIDQPYEGTYNLVQRAIAGADTITALTLGNSHAASVDFETLQIKGGYHLHAGFMDVFELYHLSSYIIPKLPHLHYVFIAVPYYFFDFDNAAYNDSYQLSFRKRTYFMTPRMDLIGNDPRNLVSAKMSPIIRPDHWKGVFSTLLKTSLQQVAVFRPVTAPQVDSLFLMKHAKGRVKQNETQVDTMLSAHPNLSKKTREVLMDVVRLCKEQGVTPIFYTPSYHHFYSSSFSDTIKSRNLFWMEEIALTGNVAYYDFSSDSVLPFAIDYYIDSDHYNWKGKQEFSRKLRDSLVQNGILQE